MTNLMFVTIDDYLSLDAWPLYKGVAITPNMDALQQSSANFSAAFADVAVCNPSRAALLTGQTPWKTGVTNNSQQLSAQVDLQNETLPGILQNAGMYTALGGKIFHDFRGTDQTAVADVVLNSTGLRSSTSAEFENVQHVAYGGTDELLADDALSTSVNAFLHTYTSDTPFALFAGIYRPHVDWIVPQEYIDMYDGIDIPLPDFVDYADRDGFISASRRAFHEDVLDANAWQDLVKHYLASVTYADAKLGEMLASLNASGHADDTLVVVMSDHGYHLGESGLWHKFTTYEQAARVPLVISQPGEGPSEITAPVNLSSVAATVLDLLGLPPSDDMEPSLAPYLAGQAPTGDEYAVTWSGASMTIRTADYRYTRYEGGAEQLFDMRTDIMGENNIAAQNHQVLGQFRLLFEEAKPDDVFIRPTGPSAGSEANSYYYFGAQAYEITDAGGIDKVFISSDYVLPEGIENLEGREIGVGLRLEGNASDNRLSGSRLSDVIIAYAGNDYITGNDGDDVMHGGDGDDVLLGVNGNDTMLGEQGNDYMFGDQGNDILIGGDGNDDMDGGAGSDELYGDHGNDILKGDSNPDELYGGVGDDLLNGGQGNDRIDGGIGTDTAVFSGARSAYTLASGGVYSFRIDGPDGFDRVFDVERLQFSDMTISVEEFVSPGSDPASIASGETLDGSLADGTLIGGAGDDVVLSTASAEVLSLGAGVDRITGYAHEHFGDTITDFSSEDQLIIRNAALTRDQIGTTGTPTRLWIDTNGDGVADGSIALMGDFSGGDFMVVSYGDETTISFGEYLPELADRKSVRAEDVNGIINTAFLEGDGSTDFTVTMRDIGYAQLSSTLGVYEVRADGSIADVRILVENANAPSSEPIVITGVEAGHQLGFFLVQDGADWAAQFDNADTFDFADTDGNAARAGYGPDIALRVNGQVQDLIIFHSFDEGMNPYGVEHVLSGVEPGGKQMTIGFEDLIGGGDRDYEDVVFTLERVDTGLFS